MTTEGCLAIIEWLILARHFLYLISFKTLTMPITMMIYPDIELLAACISVVKGPVLINQNVQNLVTIFTCTCRGFVVRYSFFIILLLAFRQMSYINFNYFGESDWPMNQISVRMLYVSILCLIIVGFAGYLVHCLRLSKVDDCSLD